MKLRGIRIPHKKNTAGIKAVRIEVPETVVIPMSMHIGKHASLLVGKGDHVKVGQLIGEADGHVSANIHSSVSGTVTAVGDCVDSHGGRITSVTIASDGKQELYEGISPPEVNDFASFIAAIKESGIVGLGGAGFPTFAKLHVEDLERIEFVIINAAECEPYITSDTRTMIDDSESIADGIEALRKYLGAKRFILGIENNKKEAAAKMQELADRTEGLEVHVLPSIYPQGGEKVLVWNTVRRIIPAGKIPIDVGAVVINVTTLAAVGKYLKTGIPLIEKCITVDGSAVREPKNLIVPVGTPIRTVLEAAGGLKTDPAKILYGGPMMGIAVPSQDEPVLKNTNAIIAMGSKEAALPRTTACISCGECIRHCPLRLDPRGISRAYKLGDDRLLRKHCVNICMECGCCSYVCPANRPLVQTNILAKARLKAFLKKEADK